MLILVFAESALETVPRDLWSHPAVGKHSRRRKKQPGLTILDRSYHHGAMKGLSENEKRGRPDIIHFSLLEALGSPLNRAGLLEVHVHTIDDHVIYVDPQIRLPRNYERFIGLMEQLFQLGKVPKTGPALLSLEPKTISDLIMDIGPDYVVAFSRLGSSMTLRDVMTSLSSKGRLAAIIGGFPKGHFSEETVSLTNEMISIDFDALEAWTVASRVIYEYEKSIFLDKKRLRRHS